VATNTTIQRSQVQGLPHAEEAGGLSGAPVLEASNQVIRSLRAALGPGFPIIGWVASSAPRMRYRKSRRVPMWCRSTPG
jgi:hypothetical protein